MATVAIVGILATIASVAYTSQVQKSRRTDARSALLDLAGREEKLFSTTNAYSATATDLGYAAFPVAVGSGYYNVNVAVGNPPVSYVLTATAIGTQVNDAHAQRSASNSWGCNPPPGPAPRRRAGETDPVATSSQGRPRLPAVGPCER